MADDALPPFTILADEGSLPDSHGRVIPDPIRVFALEGTGVRGETFMIDVIA